jgi:hypothetical protein
MINRRISLIQIFWNGWFLSVLISKLFTPLHDWISLMLFLSCFVFQIVAQYLLIQWIKEVSLKRHSFASYGEGKNSAEISKGGVVLSRKEGALNMKHKENFSRFFFIISGILFSIYLFRIEVTEMFFILFAGIICYLVGIELFFRVLHELKQSLPTDSEWPVIEKR